MIFLVISVKYLAGFDQLMHYSTSMFVVRWKDLLLLHPLQFRRVLD